MIFEGWLLGGCQAGIVHWYSEPIFTWGDASLGGGGGEETEVSSHDDTGVRPSSQQGSAKKPQKFWNCFLIY